MQRRPAYPVANCSIKMRDNVPVMESAGDDDGDENQRRQMLINFGHSQWGFNNWSWSVKKQDLDFVDFANGKYSAGVVSFVTVTVKSFDIHRENIGYATCTATMKGSAIHQARKCAVTNALRETLLSFGGGVASELSELLEANKLDAPSDTVPDSNTNHANKQPDQKPPVNFKCLRKEPEPASIPANSKRQLTSVKNGMPTPTAAPPPLAAPPPPVTALPLPQAAAPTPLAAPPPPLAAPATALAAAPPLRAAAPPPAARSNSNEVLKPGSSGLEGLTEEEARAERKRRQRLAQEEFRQKQLMKHKPGIDEKQDLSKSSNSFDKLLMEIPTQDIQIEETGNIENTELRKRKSPVSVPDGSSKRRGSIVINKLDILTD